MTDDQATDEQRIGDGGPAFPTAPSPGFKGFADISAREAFASGQAAGAYALDQSERRTGGELKRLFGESYTQADVFVYFCLEFADAMIAQRKKVT